MMLLKVEQIEEGLHPSETFAVIETESGREQVAVDPKSVRDGLPVGWPVGKKSGYLLVELPRPTVSGARRVWVRKDELISDKAARKRA